MTYEFFAMVGLRKETAVFLLLAADDASVVEVVRLADGLERRLGGLLRREGIADGLLAVRVEFTEKEDDLELALVSFQRFGLRSEAISSVLAKIGCYQPPSGGRLN